MKTAAVLGVLLLLGSGGIDAQSNEILDTVLAAPRGSYGHAAYLFLAGDGTIDEQASFEAAVTALEQILPLAIERAVDEPLTLGEFALLVQLYYDLPRGLMGRLVAAPRYAVRDLRFLRVVQGRSYPNMQLSGEQMIRIVGRVLAYQEGAL